MLDLQTESSILLFELWYLFTLPIQLLDILILLLVTYHQPIYLPLQFSYLPVLPFNLLLLRRAIRRLSPLRVRDDSTWLSGIGRRPVI